MAQKEQIGMFNITTRELEWGGRTLSIETGRMARQANGAALVRYGETQVLCTAVASRNPRPNVDFFPLTVNYQERYFASGKIPGGFFKRERGQSEAETLISRLIDRPIRPLFDDNFRNETQVIATVLSHDIENDPDIVAMIAASAALALSGLPFHGPIGAARVGYRDDNFILNPEISDLPDSQLDLVVAGTRDAVMMVESEAAELPESVMLNAVTFGHEQMQPVIAAITELAAEAGAEPWTVETPDHGDLSTRVQELAEAGIRTAVRTTEKKLRREKLDEVHDRVRTELAAEYEENPTAINDGLKTIEKKIVRSQILNDGERIDGRDLVTVRPIACEVSLLPRTHGSALFTRGETQALAVTTLGTGEDEQIMNLLHANYRERFMLHYNFPPFSVGETRMMRAPGRREIGHGKLAWRALRPVLPEFESFPYTVRIVSEVLESNGSSSMATVCSSSLAMMDAGVPLKRPVAGIAMGLILEGEEYAVITDILGDEDHLGDMDFKVAGTEQGVTSLQMDIKVAGITSEIMETALAQAKDARMHILAEMAKALSEGRKEFSAHAPRIEIITIAPDKIGLVKGTGGKTIRSIVEETNTKIDIGDDGTIKIASPDLEQIEAAKARINGLTAEPVPGTVYEATVMDVKDFGAFVSFCGPKDGLVHVSNMENRRVDSPHDVVKKGQKVKVLYRGTDERGRAQLSMRAVNQETGEVQDTGDADSAPRGRPGGGGGGGGRRDFRGGGDRRGGSFDRDRPPRESRGPRRERSDDRWDNRPPAFEDDDWGNRPSRRAPGGDRKPRRPRHDHDE